MIYSKTNYTGAKTIFASILIMIFLLSNGCKKLIEIDPPSDRLVSTTIFSDSVTAVSAINGAYSQLYNGQGTGQSFYSYMITAIPARYADESVAIQNTLDPFYTNTLTSGIPEIRNLWANSYNTIYNANSIIEGAAESPGITATLKMRMIAEAKFIRAFCHFYLLNYFGEIPIITTTDLNVNKQIGRKPANEVYAQIISDLKDAKNDLPTDYSVSSNERTRANSYAASALLARVHLYTGDWPAAESEASRLIQNTSLYEIDQNLDHVFLATSKEAIFSFNVNVYGCTYIARYSILTGVTTPTTALSPSLLNAFETKDLRRSKWINSIAVNGINYAYSYKYKISTDNGDNTEKELVLRIAETYLIRAEARMQQNNFQGAQNDLNITRLRANLDKSTALDKTSLTIAIAQERQRELFHEWGHRFLDLKRSGMADAVLKDLKSGWQSNDILFPIPQSAINTNTNLKQNPGYN